MDPILSDSRDPMTIFANSRDPNRVPKTLLKNPGYTQFNLHMQWQRCTKTNQSA